MSKSEVAELRRRIELECEAIQRAMTGFAAGAARHEFIMALCWLLSSSVRKSSS
jgi:hypothetical protein